MRHYTQLTREERYQIYALKTAGHNQVDIAKIIGRHKSTASRELTRNRGLMGYRPKQANNFVTNRRREKSPSRISSASWERVELLLREDWSPEQVSVWLRREEDIRISHEWIYQYILRDKHKGGDLHRHLRCQKPRRKRYGASDRRGQLKERFPLMSAQRWSTNAAVLATGKLTPSLENKEVTCWSLSLNARPA